MIVRSGASSGVLRVIERERLVIAFSAVFGAFALLELPEFMLQDGWLALVAGRSIAHNGLPDADALTVYTRGYEWVDQQWLGQLAFYRLHEFGGLRLLMLTFAVLITGALIVAIAAARRAGASPLAVGLVVLPALASYGWIALPVRTQVFGFVLFAVTLWLLVEDARRPSRRVLWVLPLLVVWANLHGSVLLGAGLVVLRGACAVVGVWRGDDRNASTRGLLLVVGGVLAIFVSPYALDLPHYYAATAFNPQFTALVTEWHRTTPQLATAPFYFLLFAAVALLARHPRSVTTYEKLALLATAVMGLLALRNVGWFALAAIIILPLALQQSLPTLREGESRRAVLPIAYGPMLCFVLALVATAARPSTWFEHRYPAGPADAVARIVAADPRAKVFASLRYADWLMWTHPSLEGRIAYDARLELLAPPQLRSLVRFSPQLTDGWRAIDGYDVIVLARDADPTSSNPATMYRALMRDRRFRLAYLDSSSVVLAAARGR